MTTITTKQDREKAKESAVTLREQGKLKESIELFDQLIQWDENNNNLRGKLDVLGHKRIAISKLADKETDIKKKQELAHQATLIAEEAISYEGKEFPITKGVIAAQYIHLASAYFDESILHEGKEAAWLLKRARESINIGIETYEGPISAQVWPLGIKARIVYAEGKVKEAFDILCDIQKNLFDGYTIEEKAEDQMDLKYRIWLTTTFKTMATICDMENKPLLAQLYWGAIIGIPDPENVLENAKKLAESKLKK